MVHEYRFSGRATAPGSTRYYAVRMAPPALRDALALLFEWQWELQAICHRCSDPGVALTKLQWYREELSRALDGQAQHPLLTQLAGTAKAHRLPADSLLEMASAVEREIRGIVPEEITALKAHGEQGSGNLLQLITRVCGGNEAALACAGQLGAPLRLIEAIRDLGQDLRLGGCLLLPLERMAAHQLPPARLAEPEHREALQALLAELAAQARTWQQNAMNRLPGGSHPALLPVRVLMAIRSSLLSELERDGFTVLTQRTSLTPLRKLWIGWRTCRRYR